MAHRSTCLTASFVILLSVSSLTMSQAEGNKQVASANSHCGINCLNGGYCSFTKYTDYPEKGDVGFYQSCVCRPGFGGPSCEDAIDECQPPSYKCHNGAPCKREESGGSLSCDCSFAEAKSDLVGYMCRNPVIQACDTEDENNKSFCTNGGLCLSSMTGTSEHLMFSEPTTHEGCQCEDGFSGDHCEFIDDMPEAPLVETASSSVTTGAKAGISLSVLAVLAIFGTIFVTRRKQRQTSARLDQSWKNGEQRFRNFYSEKLAKDSGGGVDQGKSNELVMEEYEGGNVKEDENDSDHNIQSILESTDAESQRMPYVYETEAETKIV